jgi:hypothetical protein
LKKVISSERDRQDTQHKEYDQMSVVENICSVVLMGSGLLEAKSFENGLGEEQDSRKLKVSHY